MADRHDYDLSRLRAIIHESASKLKYKHKIDYSEELFTMALALSGAVKKIFFWKSEFKFQSEPEIERKPIIQFAKCMRIDAMEKYNQTTFFSAVHFYKDVQALKSGDPLGVLIVYLEQKYAPEVLRLLNYPYIDYDDDEEVLDGTGALANLIAGQLKKELNNLQYIDLEISHFRSYKNSVADGIAYPRTQNDKYEISFKIEGEKRLVVEMVMAPLPKRRL